MAEKKSYTWVLTFGGMALMFIIGVIVYLFSKDDCYTTTDGVKHCLNGFEALKLEWPAFWTFCIIGIVAAIVFGYLAYRNENSGSGSDGKTIILVILAVLCLATPWGKACTDKTNGGITAPGYQHVDSTQKN